MSANLIDIELPSMVRLLCLLDAERERLDQAMAPIREESPLMEVANDLAGLGFVVCQRYIVSVSASLGFTLAEALLVGPRCASGGTVVSSINAFANAWKHEGEWTPEPKEKQGKTLRRMDNELDDGAWDYMFANGLCALSPINRFSEVIPALEEWRDALMAAADPSKRKGWWRLHIETK